MGPQSNSACELPWQAPADKAGHKVLCRLVAAWRAVPLLTPFGARGLPGRLDRASGDAERSPALGGSPANTITLLAGMRGLDMRESQVTLLAETRKRMPSMQTQGRGTGHAAPTTLKGRQTPHTSGCPAFSLRQAVQLCGFSAARARSDSLSRGASF